MANVNTQSTKEKLQQKAAAAQAAGQVQNQNQNQQPAQQRKGRTFAEFLESPAIKSRFEGILKQRSGQFLTSILSLYNNDAALQKSDPVSIVQSAMIAASLDLPIEKNFGYAWIISYWNDKNKRFEAQFQMGYKGLIQLALRTGQYRKINAIPIHEGELTAWNALTEDLVYEPQNKESDVVIGYCAYFELLNGFVKTVYWTKEQVERHRVKFNKAKDKESMNKVWREEYDSMAMKVVLNSLLKKWGILSVDLQQAIIAEEEEPERKEINPEFSDMDFPFENVPDDQAVNQ